MKPQRVLAATALIAASFAASAQSMKPGLWEVNTRMQAASGQMQKDMAEAQRQMASMPPEQRKMVQDMMAKQGVSMGKGGPGTMGVKVCMTKEMVERNDMPSQRNDCKQITAPRSGNTMKISFTCTNPPSSGEGQITFASPEAYTMNMAMSTVVQGKPEKVNMDASGKWLSADCGAIKPRGVPKK
jgi:hypothetical protein